MIPVVRDHLTGREGYIVGYSSGETEETEWEEVLVAHKDGTMQTHRASELTFLGLLSENGNLLCRPA